MQQAVSITYVLISKVVNKKELICIGYHYVVGEKKKSIEELA